MYQNIRKFLFHTLIPAVLVVFMIPTMAFAGGASCTVNIPAGVKVTVGSGSEKLPDGVTYQLALEAVTSGAPMPAAAEITVKNGEKASFGPITYTKPEDYKYCVFQKFEKKDGFTFDNKVYYVTVQVLNDDHGGLEANIVACDTEKPDDNTPKAAEVAFANSYYKKSSSPGGGSSGGSGSGPSGGGSTTGGPGVIADELTVVPELTVPLADLPVPMGLLPKTGDTTNLALWMVLMAMSGSALVLLMLWKKRME